MGAFTRERNGAAVEGESKGLRARTRHPDGMECGTTDSVISNDRSESSHRRDPASGVRVMLVNPPYQTLTSNLGVGHQVPLGLLMVGGRLIDDGHVVLLVDAEARHLSVADVGREVERWRPDVVMTGHAGSTPAHPVCMEVLQEVKRVRLRVVTVYGGVYPTYHAEQVLREDVCVDVVVRGEGEKVAAELVREIDRSAAFCCRTAGVRTHHPDGMVCDTHANTGGMPVEPGIGTPVTSSSFLTPLPWGEGRCRGISYRAGKETVHAPEAEVIQDLNEWRVGWELIEDWDLYQCFGLGRSAIVQFSRGCPHRCTYCGQHGFWKKWRHRDPERLAEEIAWLHDQHGVKFITLADENPTTSPQLWRRFLEAMAAKKRGVQFFATIRATDIVRDRELLSLYREAGILYVLLGIDATNPALIETIRKRSTVAEDVEACKLLKVAGIRSIIGHIVGLGDESWSGFRRTMRALKRYDGDLLNAMYATPHSWTSFARQSAMRVVVQEDQRRWDYRHQVLDEKRMRPWEVFLAVKWMELRFHLRPRRLWRMVFDRDRAMRRQLRWTALHTGMVWVGEIVEFLWRVRHARKGKRLAWWIERARGFEGERVGLSVRGRMLSSDRLRTSPTPCGTESTCDSRGLKVGAK